MVGKAERAPSRIGLWIRGTIGELLDLLSDFWFGMMLLALWGLMTLIGVIVDQGKDPSFYLDNYTPALARLVLRLHLDNIYHSPAYLGIVGLIVSTMTLATFRRVIPTRLPPLRAVKIEYIPLNASVPLKGDERTLRLQIESFFSARGWLVRKREFGGVEWTFADKHEWARKGVLVAHVGFILIAAGTTLYWAFGFDGQTAILSGQSVTIPRAGAQLTLERFGYRIDPIRTRSGIVYQPIDYVSHLLVRGADGTPRQMTLRVNAPIDVDGTLYYQASYGYAIQFAVTHDGRPVPSAQTGPLHEGEGFSLDGSRAIRYARFVGTIDRRSGGIGADPRPNDPGVAIELYEGDRMIGSALIPLGQPVDLGSGFRLNPVRYVIYSGIQYRHDPGIPLVGLGAAILLGGLIASFYFVPARLFVRLDGSGEDWTLGVAATTVKGYEIFEGEFRALVDSLRKAVPPRAAAAVS